MVVVVEFFPMRRRTSTASSISFATITTDVSMVECRVLPEIACKYLVQIRHVSANCKRPPLHCYYITSRRCVYLYQLPSQQLYSSSFSRKLLFIGYRIDRYPWLLVVSYALLHTSLSNAPAHFLH